MPEKEKRIVIRVGLQKWKELDNKRHAEETSFQDIGLGFFLQWLAGDLKETKQSSDQTGEFRVKLHN